MSKKVSPEQQHKIDIVVGFLCRPPYETGGYPDTFMVVGDTYVFATCSEECEPGIYRYTKQDLIDWYDRADAMAAKDDKDFSEFFDPKVAVCPEYFEHDDWRTEYFYEAHPSNIFLGESI